MNFLLQQRIAGLQFNAVIKKAHSRERASGSGMCTFYTRLITPKLLIKGDAMRGSFNMEV